MSIQVITYRDAYFADVSPLDTALWRQVTNNFGIAPVRFVDDDINIDLNNLVVFDENGEIPLAEFKHPENATYLFGCTGMQNIHEMYPSAPSVRIEVPQLVINRGMFGSQAAAIVLYDRERKSWQ